MPFRLTRAESKGPKKTFAADILIGTTFVGDIKDTTYTDTLFLRTYVGLVSLDRPQNTWDDLSWMEIENYRSVDIVGEVREIN